MSKTFDEETLRYWLSNEEHYPSRYTQDFLKNVPAAEARDVLARIAEDAEPEPHSYGSLFFNAFATAGFLPSAGGKIPRRKAGVRAALLLASLNDARCLPALIRVFETESVWQNKYQDDIVAALIRYLENAAKTGTAQEYTREVRALAERIWQQTPNKDLPHNFAKLVYAAVSYLAAAKKDSVAREAVQRFARATARFSFRAEIQEFAQSLLDNTGVER